MSKYSIADGCIVASVLLALVMVLAPVTYIINGLVLKVLWLWFIAETFGLPVITVAQAIGLSIVVGFLTHQDCQREKTEDAYNAAGKLIVTIFVGPLLALGIGYIVHLFV